MQIYKIMDDEITQYIKHNDKRNILQLFNSNHNFINYKNVNGDTLLHMAAMEGNKTMAQLFIRKKISVDCENNENQTPLHLACEHGNQNVVRMLTDKFADMDAEDNLGYTPLHYASLYGYNKIAKNLMDKYCDIEIEDDEGNTPLHIACKNGQTEIVKLLLKYGALVNSENNYLDTPLHLAAAHYNGISIIKLLLKYGADIHRKNWKGDTPIHKASCKKMINTCFYLINNGAEIFHINNFHRTSLDVYGDEMIIDINVNINLIEKMLKKNEMIDKYIRYTKWFSRKHFVMFLSSFNKNYELIEITPTMKIVFGCIDYYKEIAKYL
jgi:ankyrin repeat protein